MRSNQWNPGVAAVLSVLMPGLGQIYKGWIGRGFAFLIFTVLGYMVVILPGLALHIWAIVDAYNGQSRAEAEYVPSPSNLFDEQYRRR